MILVVATTSVQAAPPQATPRPIQLRCYEVPIPGVPTIDNIAKVAVVRGFHTNYPQIQANSSEGLRLPGVENMDMVPLLKIAGGIPEDCIYVNFRQSDTYIRQHKLLYPLDAYVEALAFTMPKQRAAISQQSEASKAYLPNGHLMTAEEYFGQLIRGPNGTEIAERVPPACFKVIFRSCPYKTDCQYLQARGVTAPTPEEHRHIWAYPIRPVIMGLSYRRDLFAEVGLPDRVPNDWQELLEWGKLLTDPSEKRYGLTVGTELAAWEFCSFLFAIGGRLVEQDEHGDWRCVFDSPEAIEAAHFFARLKLEQFTAASGKKAEGIIYRRSLRQPDAKVGMEFSYISSRYLSRQDASTYNFGPVPMGPTGKRGSEFNSAMYGIYAGLAADPVKRDAAWKFIHYLDSPDARKIRTQAFVENGYGRYVNPVLLQRFGYHELARQVPPGWQEAYETSLTNGVPEPYGKNCQRVYDYPSHAITEMWNDRQVRAAIQSNDKQQAMRRIQEIFTKWVNVGNSEMLQRLTPQQNKQRGSVAWAVVIVAVIAFGFVFYRVFKAFTPEQLTHQGGWQLRRYKWAYLLLLPAVGTILLWQYYPLARGTFMAFQDYNVRGFSTWVGMDNFANALFDRQFWFSLWVSLKYAFLFMLFAFFTPIFLAILLQEVPKGKILFRVIYYLPAVLSGAVVLFLWKSFYSPAGPVNQLIEYLVATINLIFRSDIEFVPIDWLNSKTFALPFCLLPTIWAGMGPGCLIYLAALKTIPEDLYEAADLDGASLKQKVFQVTLPSIKMLIMINFIFALIGSIRGAGSFMLAMTGGGPARTTEVVGLTIWYTAFARLNFGLATAQAWILGAMLIGFTIFQLKRLSQVEFRTAEKVGSGT